MLYKGTEPLNVKSYKGIIASQSLLLIALTIALVYFLFIGLVSASDKYIDNQSAMFCNSAKVSGNLEWLKNCQEYYRSGNVEYLRNY